MALKNIDKWRFSLEYPEAQNDLLKELQTKVENIATLVNELKADYNAAVTLINELKLDLSAHTHTENTEASYTQNATTGAAPTIAAADADTVTASDITI